MNALNLTYKQCEKLTEMCKILFPNDKSKNPSWQNEVKTFKDSQNKEYVIKYFEDNSFEENDPDLWYLTFGNDCRIHWFEFCVVYLVLALKHRGIHIDYWMLTLNPNHCQWPKEYNHPVDYLYEEFLLQQTIL